MEAAIEYMCVPGDLSFEVTIHSEAPGGASTGTSAAVTVALIGALDSLTPGRLTPHEVAFAAQRPDGQYVSYTVPAETGVNEVRVVRFTDGEPLGFRIELPGTEQPNGRNRWMKDGRSLAFNWNQATQSGIFAQEFIPGSDTRASRRALVLIEPGGFAETFGISPDGKRLTLATSHRSFGLLSAENVPGIEPPVRRGR